MEAADQDEQAELEAVRVVGACLHADHVSQVRKNLRGSSCIRLNSLSS